jgi:NitT/TauT family transport system substrate-binding protein
MIISRRMLLQGSAVTGLAGLAPSGLLAQEAMAVRIQDFGVNLVSLPLLYGKAFDLFATAGVTLKDVPPIFSTAGIMQSVMNNQADIGYTGATAIVPAVAQGRNLKIVAVVATGMELKLSLTKAAADRLAAKGITANSPFKERLQALKGLRLSAPATGSSTYQGVQYQMKKNGLDAARDVTIQPMPDMAAQIASMRQGAVDGIFGTIGSGVGQAEADGAVRFIAFEREDPSLQTIPWNVLIATDSFIKEKPQAVRGVVKAFAEAKKAINAGLKPEEIDAIKKRFFPDMPQATFDTIYRGVLPLMKGSLVGTAEQLQTLTDINNSTADMPSRASFEQVFDNRFAREFS